MDMKTTRIRFLHAPGILMAALVLAACGSTSDDGLDNHRLPAPSGIQNRQPAALAPSPTSRFIPPPIPTQCEGFEPETLSTIGAVIDALGKPEKVYHRVARRYIGGGYLERYSGTPDHPSFTSLVTTHLLYPQKGVDFITSSFDSKLKRDTSVKSHECYVPVTLQLRMRQKPGGYVGGA